MIRILVPLDGSTLAEEALPHAAAVARVFPAELTLVRVIAEVDHGAEVHMDSVDLALWRYQAQAYLEAVRGRYGAEGFSIRCQVMEGDPADSIVRSMARSAPDLLVLTRYGCGSAQDFAAGGTAQKLLSAATCSVLLLDPHSPIDPARSYQRILVPVDQGKDSDCAVAVATMIAEVNRSSMVLLRVIEEPHVPRGLPATPRARHLVNELHGLIRDEALRRLNELAEKIPGDIQVERRILASADTPFAIESVAEDYNSDLLLLHTLDQAGGCGRRYGAVIQSLIQYLHRPLFILQAAGTDGGASNFRSVYLSRQGVEVD